MKKFKIFANFEKEEKWLAEMAEKGHILKSYSGSGIYTFIDSTPQHLNYKIDYKRFADKSEYISYIALFEDAGWQHIWGSKSTLNHYFLPKNEQAGTEIFSDAESANTRYKTLSQICLGTLTTCIVLCVASLSLNNFNFSTLIFKTPGLWDKVGEAFWQSFLLELPFALVRIGLWVMLLVIGIAYGYWAIKSKKEYDCRMREKEKA